MLLRFTNLQFSCTKYKNPHKNKKNFEVRRSGWKFSIYSKNSVFWKLTLKKALRHKKMKKSSLFTGREIKAFLALKKCWHQSCLRKTMCYFFLVQFIRDLMIWKLINFLIWMPRKHVKNHIYFASDFAFFTEFLRQISWCFLPINGVFNSYFFSRFALVGALLKEHYDLFRSKNFL